ncbi:hypothetical protein NSTCB13_05563 [Nostoc sp. DSM 114160]|jgi:hypothetical protein
MQIDAFIMQVDVFLMQANAFTRVNEKRCGRIVSGRYPLTMLKVLGIVTLALPQTIEQNPHFSQARGKGQRGKNLYNNSPLLPRLLSDLP